MDPQKGVSKHGWRMQQSRYLEVAAANTTAGKEETEPTRFCLFVVYGVNQIVGFLNDDNKP